MTDSPELAWIRARDCCEIDGGYVQASEDRRTLLRLLGEVRRENQRLIAEGEAASAARMRIGKIIAERDALAAERDRLERSMRESWASEKRLAARVAALEAALREACDEVPLGMALRFDKLLGRLHPNDSQSETELKP